MERKAFETAANLKDEHWWFAGRRRIVETFLLRLSLPAGCRIIELGCGVGANLAWLSRHGDLTGLEPDPQAREHARAQHCAEILAGELPDDLPLARGHYHLAVLLDVLEHIEDHGRVLEAVRELLLEDGLLLLTVPAFPFLWSSHDELSRHKRRYRRGELLRLLDRAGFEPLRVSHFNTLLFPLSCAVALVDRLGLGRGNWFRPHHPILNAVLKILFSLESLAVPWMSLPFGTTLAVAARKTRSVRSKTAGAEGS